MPDSVEFLMELAGHVSNMGKPESDNNYGRAATEIKQLREKVSHYAKLLDDQYGTPCEQIKHQQEIERLRTAVRLAMAYCDKSKLPASAGDVIQEALGSDSEHNPGPRCTCKFHPDRDEIIEADPECAVHSSVIAPGEADET